MKSRVSWLNLHKWIPQRDVRKKIYALLSPLDRNMIRFAHNSKRGGGVNMCKNMCEAAENGYCEVIEWLLTADKSSRCFDETVCAAAAKGGQLETLKYLRSLGFELDDSVPCNAAKEGHLHVLKWILNQDESFARHAFMHFAAQNGYLDMFKYLYHEVGLIPVENDMRIAALAGNFHIVDFLLDCGYVWNTWMSHRISAAGNVAALKWAKEKGVSFDQICIAHALTNDSPETFKWLIDNGCTCGPPLFDSARQKWPNENF